MDGNEVVELELHLSGVAAEKTLDQFLERTDDLVKTFRDIGIGFAKLLKIIEKSLDKTIGKFDDVTEALSEITRALQKVCETLSTSGLENAVNQINGILDNVIGAIGLVVDLIANDMLKGFDGVLQKIGATIIGVLSKIDIKVAVVVTSILLAIAAIIAIVKNWDKISNAIKVFTTETLPQAWEQFSNWLSNMTAGVTGFFANVWNGIAPLGKAFIEWIKQTILQPIIDQCNGIAQWFRLLLESLGATAADIIHNIGVILTGGVEILKAVWNEAMLIVTEGYSWMKTNILDPLGILLAGVWDKLVVGAKAAWETVKDVFSQVAGFFRSVFETAWNGVVSVFSVAGEIFTDIKNGILTAFKKIVNALIGGINTVVKIPFDGINSALRKIRDVQILDLMPFAGIKAISVPQIPYLARGAVLPANKPFLAMVGDQKHGTNIEAPLATIQEAVALVLDDQISALQAGFSATVRELQQLRAQVGGIQVGDAVIGRAANRYNEKMTLLQGGY